LAENLKKQQKKTKNKSNKKTLMVYFLIGAENLYGAGDSTW